MDSDTDISFDTDFFAADELERRTLWSLDFFNPSTFIMHSDLECPFCGPAFSTPMVDLIRHPWDESTRNLGKPLSHQSRFLGAPDPDTTISTELSEHDLIMGNPRRLNTILDLAVAAPPSPLTIFCTPCPSVVTGEDVRSVVRRHQEQSPVPMLLLEPRAGALTSMWHDLLAHESLQGISSRGARRPNTINLIGFQRNDATRKLISEVLSPAGVEVNSLLLPGLDVEGLARFGDASLNVFFPNALWAEMYELIGELVDLPGMTPPSPYGVKGVRAWLAAVLDVLGLEVDMDTLWDQLCTAKFRERWTELCNAAGDHWLGFVIGPPEKAISSFTDPARTWGVPLLEVVGEAGFGLELFVGPMSDASDVAAVEAIERTFGESHKRLAVRAFSNSDELLDELRESRCEAVFTNYFFDRRITGSGKAAFSTQDYEMGFSGAIATAERLLRLCTMSLYRDYGRYLGSECRAKGVKGAKEPSKRAVEAGE